MIINVSSRRRLRFRPTLLAAAAVCAVVPVAFSSATPAFAASPVSAVRTQGQPAAPVVTGTVAGGKLTLTWAKVSGAKKYQVLRDDKVVATVTATKWSGSVGAAADYQVRSVSALGTISVPSDTVRASSSGIEAAKAPVTTAAPAAAAAAPTTTKPTTGVDSGASVPIEPLGPVATPRLPVTVKDALGFSVTITSIDRIVTLGGDSAEILYSLGLNDKVVGNDLSSLFPDAVAKKPKVGIFSNFSAEGVLKLQPTLVIALPTSGPATAMAALRAAGIPVFTLVQPQTPSAATIKIRTLASALGIKATGDRLADLVQSQMTEARAKATAVSKAPIVAYLTYRGNNLFMFGRDSDPCHLIVEAGGICAGTTVGILDNASIVTPEVLLKAKPDIIIAPTDAVAALGGLDQFKALPAVAVTPATKSGNIYTFDVNFSQGYGPRTGKAMLEYNRLIASLAK